MGVRVWRSEYVSMCCMCTPRGTQSYHLLAFGRLVCVCTLHMLSKYSVGAREGFLHITRHVREGWCLAPHGTVCYHSASLIPLPHVCNLTWWWRVGGSEREKNYKLNSKAAKKIFPAFSRLWLIWFLPVFSPFCMLIVWSVVSYLW